MGVHKQMLFKEIVRIGEVYAILTNSDQVWERLGKGVWGSWGRGTYGKVTRTCMTNTVV